MKSVRRQTRLSGVLVLLAAAFSSPVLAQYWLGDSAAEPSPYRLDLPDGDSYKLASLYRQSALPTRSQIDNLPFAGEVDLAAKASGLDPALVHALIAIESGHRQDAVSPRGAVGLMQLMPGTALRYGVRAPGKSPYDNLLAGTRYLRDLMRMFDNRLDLVLAAYNAGEGAVFKYGNRIPPYRETLDYVPAVLKKYENWRTAPSRAPGPTVYLPGTLLEPKAHATLAGRLH